MRFKTFEQIFESTNYKEILRDFIEKMPGENNDKYNCTILNADTEYPCLIFEIYWSDRDFWKNVSIREKDDIKIIKWCKKVISDSLFGDDGDHQGHAFYKIDFNDSELDKIRTYINSHGLAIDVAYLGEFDPENPEFESSTHILIRFKEDKDLQYAHRGNIARKNFGQ